MGGRDAGPKARRPWAATLTSRTLYDAVRRCKSAASRTRRRGAARQRRQKEAA